MKKLVVTNLQENHSTLLTVDEIMINNGFNNNEFHEQSLKRLP